MSEHLRAAAAGIPGSMLPSSVELLNDLEVVSKATLCGCKSAKAVLFGVGNVEVTSRELQRHKQRQEY